MTWTKEKISKYNKKYYRKINNASRKLSCEQCDEEFFTNRKGIVKYCSNECYGKSKKGIFSFNLKKYYEENVVWNKGKRRPEISGKNNCNYGKKLSKEHKEKLMEGQRKYIEKYGHYFKGKKLSKEHVKKLKEARKKQITPIKDTSIEVKIQNFLKQLGIEFFTHQYMKIEHGYQCDVLIPSMNLVIECDGDYWHKYPIGLDKDHIRTKELIEKGFKVLRLWERDIKVMNISDFKEKINL